RPCPDVEPAPRIMDVFPRLPDGDTKPAGARPVATAPIAVAEPGVSACWPPAAPFRSRMKAVTFSADVSPKDLGLAGGMVWRISPKSSLTMRERHLIMNVPPARDGASPEPSKSAPWHPEQIRV